jgi:phosphoribosylglycinamide formyltransferase-1
MNVKNIALFASGTGTNARNIIEYFSNNEHIKVDSIWSNKPDAFALVHAERLGVKTFVFDRATFYNTDQIMKQLIERNVGLIVLAGFLWLIPPRLIRSFTIINIHPALLPKYGGKGMYGMNVHRAVVENGDTETGITIHYVNEAYDDGKIIFQAKCPVNVNDSPDDVARKVHQLEYDHFPVIIEKILMNGE